MPKICYVAKRFTDEHTRVIEQAEAICLDYEAQGFSLTLRQLYYQFVARGLIPNRDSEYKRLGGIISDARRAGLIDWDHLEDRTRYVRALSHWESPSEMARSAADSYRKDLWRGQDYRVEVWIEKDALVGVIQDVCERNDASYFSCRGYTSDSEVWRAGRRLRSYALGGQLPVVLHLGDHDPSGIDMTRDITDRLQMFAEDEIEVRRLALNMDQIDQYDPPPNPAKTTDSRYAAYIALHGDESWELDALEPTAIEGLIQNAIDAFKDQDIWEEREREVEQEKSLLEGIADNWEYVANLLVNEGLVDEPSGAQGGPEDEGNDA